ncbi:MAG: hypothetical protein LC731_02715, partial [Acidobacteria bacterium]|nr:hypothetical protein [Acidobacteriota bacterium]
LKYGLAVVLIFVGLKMVWLNDLYGGKFPITVSLGVIGGVLVLSIGLSLLFPKAAGSIVEEAREEGEEFEEEMEEELEEELNVKK